MLNKLIYFCLHNKLVVLLLIVFVVMWGMMVAPFDWQISWLPRNPVPVDAIPNIGENQQIVFTEWQGRSPQDIEDQITYPLTVSLLGVPGVKTIRSYSYFGFSTIYIIFEEDIEFYWSRTRVLEKLNSLPANTLPQGVNPTLGPDATALGQIFWYTLEGRDPQGNPTGGWDLHELRTVQDWYVRYALQSAEGVSEVASVGGFVREYQIDVDPNAMRAYDITLDEVFNAVRQSNLDVGARTIEVNRVEYMVRGLGFLKNVDDIENSVVKARDNTPVLIKHVANVTLGPALRRGALDKAGAEAVGGVVVVRFNENPLKVIQNVKAKIQEISSGLPRKTLDDGTVSQVTIVPFYDRTGLIYETLGTLKTALTQEVFITVIVVLILVNHLRSSLLISGLLPISVLMCFIAMKYFGVDANIVALSGIAIAIGTIVDMGIVMSENMLRRLEEAGEEDSTVDVIYNAACEVGSAILTAVATTVVSFLPVFAMVAAEGKLFKPLAYTKTFALVASIITTLTIIPPMAHWLFTRQVKSQWLRQGFFAGLGVLGLYMMFTFSFWIGLLIAGLGGVHLLRGRIPPGWRQRLPTVANGVCILAVTILLAEDWMPLGPGNGSFINTLFVAAMVASVLSAIFAFLWFFEPILRWALANKKTFLLIPAFFFVLGMFIWLGTGTLLGFLPNFIKQTPPYQMLQSTFPGLGREFMPPLDEGSFLYMPSTMPHASIGESLDALQKMDMAIAAIPEVEQVVGKIGRADTPLDPAPVSMVETVINYKTEFKTNAAGQRLRFRYDWDNEKFVRDENGELIPDPNGLPFRQWRDSIQSPQDIWEEIVRVAKMPGSTSSPKLQPIETRLIMLQTGMRAPMGVKVRGPDLETIAAVVLQVEEYLQQVPSVRPETVLADRIVGKPYLEIDIDRQAIARYGITIGKVQDVIEIAIGGRHITTTVEGRERYPVRVRYMRELRDEIELLGGILVPAPSGEQIPLRQLAEIRYIRGPQMIKSEDTFLVGYVTFDKQPNRAEVEVVRECQAFLQSKLDSGEWELPAGVSYAFAGNYQNQLRSARTLRVVLPLALFLIFMILYLQFRSTTLTLFIFTGIFVAWSGGFIMIWLYGQPWFLDFSILGMNMRDLFQVHTMNLSVAVWVGFLALFGIATDNGVIIATYIKQALDEHKPDTIKDVRESVVLAGKRRIRPCLMTSATTILALLPILSSTGRGADVMVPMAIPSFGGMLMVLVSVFVVPVLYCWICERRIASGTMAEH